MTAPTVTSLLVGSSALEVEIVLAQTNVDLTVVDSTMGLQVGSAAVVTAVLVGGPAGPPGAALILRTDVVPAGTSSSYTLSQVAASVGLLVEAFHTPWYSMMLLGNWATGTLPPPSSEA